MDKRDLYICFTPYHIILTYLRLGRNDEDVVFLIDDTGKLSSYERILNRIFKYSHFIKFHIEENNLFQRQLILPFGAKRYIDELIRSLKSDIGNVYVYNDIHPVSQYVMMSLGCRNIYIEDGSSPYNNNSFVWTLSHKIKCAIAYGLWYCNVSIIGNSKYISSLEVMYPDLVRQELKDKKIDGYKLRNDYMVLLEDMNIGNNAYIPREEDDKRILVVLLPKISEMSNKVRDKIIEIVHVHLDNNWSVFEKKHPLDVNNECITGESTIDSSIAAEVIPVYLKTVTKIVGVETTSLISYRKLYPSIIATNICGDSEELKTFHSKLESIGVELVYA